LRTGAWYQYSDTEVEVLDSKVGYECEVTEKESAKKTPVEFFREKITFYFMEVSVRFEKGFFQLRAVYQNSNSAPHLLQCL